MNSIGRLDLICVKIILQYLCIWRVGGCLWREFMTLDLLFARVLIADADLSRVTPLRYALQEAGYVVRRVGTLEALERSLRQEPPDVLLLAEALPDADGYMLVRRIKRSGEFAFVPIIMLLAEGDEASIAQAVDAGADEVLTSPVSLGTLFLRVRAMVRFKRINDERRALNETLEQKVQERTRQLEEAQMRLRHAEKLSALGRLAATIAHEINNPLSGILTYLYLMKSELGVDDPMREDLSLLEREVNRIADLVKRLRSFSKPVQHERKPIVLIDVLNDVLLLVAKELEKAKITVDVQSDADLPPVQASAGEMHEVFMNLILNARDAMPQGGNLHITLKRRDPWVEICVADTGTGIPETVRDRIFEPFFTTKGEHGTGLGLSICYRIVQEHGGDMYVESQEGAGTTFHIFLPQPEPASVGA